MKKIIIGAAVFFGVAVLAGCGDDPATRTGPTGVQPTTPPPVQQEQSDDDRATMQEEEMKKEEFMEDDGAIKKDGDGRLSADLDGTHNLAVAYTAPPGEELVHISLIVEDGVITSARATPTATHETSVRMQDSFTRSFSAAVLGKEIKGLNVDVIGGASLTTAGFNAAVAKLSA